MSSQEKTSRKFHFTTKKIRALKPHDRNSPSTDQEYSDSEVIGLRVFVSKNGRKTFHLRYWLNERKRVIKIADTDCILLTEARATAREYKAMIARGKDPLDERTKSKTTPTFQDFIENSYMPWAKAHKKSWKDDQRMIAVDWLQTFGKIQLKNITRRSIQDNIMRIKRRTSGATSNRHFSLISKILSLAIDLEILEGENPCTRLKKFQESTGVERFLSKDELKRLLGALDEFKDNVAALHIKFLLFTGLRKGEVQQLLWEDIDQELKQIHIRMGNAKSNKSRFVELNSLAQSTLRDLKDLKVAGNPYIFPGAIKGAHLTNPNKTFLAAKRKAGLENLRLHDLRHSFAALSISGGASLYEVQKMLGHADHKTTQRYAHVSEGAIKQATENTAKEIMSALE